MLQPLQSKKLCATLLCMPNRRKDDLRKDVINLVDIGYSFVKIGKMLNISRQQAQYYAGIREKKKELPTGIED